MPKGKPKYVASEANAQGAPTTLLTTSEAAAYLRMRPATLVTWRSTNRQRLPYCKLGGQVRYRQADLDAFIQASLVGGPD